MFFGKLFYAGVLACIVNYLCIGIETGSWILVCVCVVIGAAITTLADSVRLTK